MLEYVQSEYFGYRFQQALFISQYVPFSMAECRRVREKRPPCPVPAILPVFPYPGDIQQSFRVDHFGCYKTTLVMEKERRIIFIRPKSAAVEFQSSWFSSFLPPFARYLIPYTAPIVHLLTTAWPPVGCWIPLGSPVERKSAMSFHLRRIHSEVAKSFP